jgi:4-hydroxy-tetrahydrodipicolinate reductase
MPAPIRIAVGGALGRMGRAVTELIADRPDAELAGRFDRPGIEDDYGCVPAEAALDAAQVVVDFSTPDATVALAGACALRGRPGLVLGATGLTTEQEGTIREAATMVPIVRSGNFSLGVNLLAGLVRQAAARLGPDYDVEILEAHHRRKVDAPSGTALMLGEAAAGGRGVDLQKVALRARDGRTGARPDGAIGFSVMRGGGIVGDHSVVFAAEDEIVTLSHSARDRTLFARGAVEAAVWVAGRRPGLYDMSDVLGFRAGEATSSPFATSLPDRSGRSDDPA